MRPLRSVKKSPTRETLPFMRSAISTATRSPSTISGPRFGPQVFDLERKIAVKARDRGRPGERARDRDEVGVLGEQRAERVGVLGSNRREVGVDHGDLAHRSA